MHKRFTVLLLASVLAGCTTAGTQVTQKEAQQFTAGVTTEKEVVAKLGKPTGETMKDDGTHTDSYIFARATPDAVDFVPIIGLLGGGSHGKATEVDFTFDKNGVLKTYSRSTEDFHVKTGLAN